jgi:NADH:ubiquinone reductase (H+-translocating)
VNIVIVGGGFGGIKSALELSKNKSHNLTLISDKPDFQYYPALFSTATGYDSKQSWVPLKEIFKKIPNVRIVIDAATTYCPENKQVVGSSGKRYKFDKAIFALGSITTYFGIDGLDTYSYGIKSEQEIRTLQKHLIEEYSDGSDDESNYVIIGGGPTGVELAGALGEYLKVLRKHFNAKEPNQAKISLIEAAPRILPRMSEKSSAVATKRLQKLGVNIETSKKVERQTADSLYVNGVPLTTQTVIWTSGVANAPFFGENKELFTLNGRGRVVVDDYMMAAPDVYVIGDNADTSYAGLAQTALHDALFVSKHILGNKKKYQERMPPSVVPVGHRWALFEWGKLRFSGMLGGIMRRAADLIGYHDTLPISWALTAWKAGTQKKLFVGDLHPETPHDH